MKDDYLEEKAVYGCLGTCLTAIISISACALLCLLFGCKNVEYIEKDYHDTLYTHKIDTFRQIVKEKEYVCVKDSSSHTEKYIKGDGVDTLVIHDLVIREIQRDKEISDSTIHAITDSLLKAVVKNEKKVDPPKPVYVEKKLSFWQKLYINVGKVSTIAILLSLLIFIYTRAKKRGWLSVMLSIIKKFL